MKISRHGVLKIWVELPYEQNFSDQERPTLIANNFVFWIGDPLQPSSVCMLQSQDILVNRSVDSPILF